MSTTTCPMSFTIPCKKKDFAQFVTVDHSVDILSSISETSKTFWDNIVPNGHVFLSYEYLQAFEASVSDNVDFRYLIFRNRGYAEGVAAFQIIRFDAANVAQAEDTENQGLGRKLLSTVIKPLSFRLLISGNAFMTGEYGMYFRDGELTANRVEWLYHGIQQIMDGERAAGKKVSGVLVKDYFLDKETPLQLFKDAGYMKFNVQPNMVVDIDPSWGNLDGYMKAMTSKYRTRVKRALKDLNGIEIRPLDKEFVSVNMDRIEHLYDQVIDNSHFKLAKFDIQHLKPMKTALGDCCRVDGFFKDGELVAFTSYLLRENGELVAGMIGFDREAQSAHDIYLNILIHLVDKGIETSSSKVIMGRTAMEIKSSIGAKPHDMVLFLRHTSGWKNAIIQPVVKFFSKNEEWTQRTPFKADRD